MAIRNWERTWAPYDEQTYRDVLRRIKPHDVVVDIGAGDLRLSTRLAAIAARVYAIEIAPLRPSTANLPGNLILLQQDATVGPLPTTATVAVLLMRHCAHFQLYAQKLRAAGCRRLITNARWGFDVECLDLQAPRRPFTAVTLGWYACWCGAVGFVPGQPEQLAPRLEQTIHEVTGCPACTGATRNL